MATAVPLDMGWRGDMDQLFEVGETYQNRNGLYEVVAIDGSRMRIRYKGGREQDVTVATQRRIWEAIIDEGEASQNAAAGSREKHRQPERPVSAAAREKVRQVMTHRYIPAGQMRLYKALWDSGISGLTLTELADATHGSAKEARSTLGALGNRVSIALGGSENSRLIVECGNEVYYLSPEMLAYIDATPSFKEALATSKQSMFDLQTPTAWRFEWNADGQSGYLEQFTR